VLDLSKIEAGKMDLYIEPLDLWTVVQEIAGLVTPLCEKRNNTLVVDCPTALASCMPMRPNFARFCSTC